MREDLIYSIMREGLYISEYSTVYSIMVETEDPNSSSTTMMKYYSVFRNTLEGNKLLISPSTEDQIKQQKLIDVRRGVTYILAMTHK